MRATFNAVIATAVVASIISDVHAADAIRWQPSLEAAQRAALQSNRLVLVHFYTNSCAPCAQLERNVFSQPAVADAIDRSFVAVKLNAEDFPARAKQWGVTTVPSDVILTSSGQVVTTLKVDGRSTPDQYVSQVSAVPARLQSMQQQQVAANAIMPVAAPQVASTASSTIAAPTAGGYANQPASVQHAVAPATQPWAASMNAAGTLTAHSNVPQAAVTPSAVATHPMPNVAPPFAAQPVASAPQPTLNAPAQQTAVWMQQSPPAANSPNFGAQAQASDRTNHHQSQRAAVAGINHTSSPEPSHAAGSPTANANAQAAPLSVQNQQPAVALDGYCTVSLFDQFHLPPEQQKWVKGDPRWGAVHRGRVYLFAGEMQQKRFLADPDTFSPALSGNDPILSLSRGVPIPGNRAYGLTYSNRIYLFANEASLNQFCESPDHYVQSVRQAESGKQTILR